MDSWSGGGGGSPVGFMGWGCEDGPAVDGIAAFVVVVMLLAVLAPALPDALA
ncbi:MAG TPA: hypothetical protein VD767_11635 [Thermomicrobiales bacterium]|nr:hypothetical protein [Thermomicrobiales bacterium]